MVRSWSIRFWNNVTDTGTGETEVVTDTSVHDGKKVSQAEIYPVQ